jgi:N-hydroxyarylamine O-acetyltransferase
MSARVAGPEGRLGPPFDHMAIRVDLAEPWLADVGFGRFALRPLRFAERGDQPDPGGVFRIAETGPAGLGDLAVTTDGRTDYVLETRPRELADFEATFWYQRTSPESHFTKSLVCSLATEDGRVSLSGTLLIRTVEGERSQQTLDGDDDVLATYRDVFGIVLDEVPTVRPAG